MMKIFKTKMLITLPLRLEQTKHKNASKIYIIECLTGCILNVDEKAIVLHTGDLILLSSFKSISLASPDRQIEVVIRTFFEEIDLLMARPIFIAGDNSLISDFLQHDNEGSTFLIFRHLQYCHGYCDQIATLEQSNSVDRYLHYEIQILVIALLTELLRVRTKSNSASDSHFPRTKNIRYTSKEMKGGAILKYMVMHIKTVNLVTIAKHFNYQPNYFSKMFREIFSQSFSDKLGETKIEMGKKLLSLTNKSIHDISEELGYKSTTSFSRNFKKRTKINPSQYRSFFSKNK
ncbi:helix-turn-helix transcriptional regulator [Lactobacillus sp. ESL0684]|uniref:helix-turn-helix transcriptional regulator n=1 Tax=unclassified Lactobacillus TaxID=2620435 RepID=UPI0023F98D26|nr:MULTISPECIES: helix-turn-helix transcriptional regulator [unclassified Lactobacillus]WEV39637.1 helix-turn-helix transcriptional regulator [Lactobacillus sp. ESL0681]WEV43834.1 helix-turn-helix transcriptional regulator [Lactobacillus sp. ESL0684]